MKNSWNFYLNDACDKLEAYARKLASFRLPTEDDNPKFVSLCNIIEALQSPSMHNLKNEAVAQQIKEQVDYLLANVETMDRFELYDIEADICK